MSALDHGYPAGPVAPTDDWERTVPVSSPAVAEIVDAFQALRGI
jgi:hypothetical protein